VKFGTETGRNHINSSCTEYRLQVNKFKHGNAANF